MASDLYKKNTYLNKNMVSLFGRRITEYDIKSAGFNIIKHFKFLPEEVISSIEKLDRHSRHVVIGKLEKNNRELAENLKKGFRACRKKFFDENDVIDSDILSIKKDAIFIIDKVLSNLEFDNIIFVPKNEYNAYMYLNKKEFYINDSICDCKGINDEKLELHKDFMLDILKEFAKLQINAGKDKQLKFIKEVAVAYRNRELEIGYYRELNVESLYRPKSNIRVMNNSMGFNEFEMDLKYLDISYNYTHYIIPMYQMLL